MKRNLIFMKILVLNAGSSSQKSRLYEIDAMLPADPPAPLWEAAIDWTSQQKAEITIKGGTKQEPIKQSLSAKSHADVLKQVLTTLWSGPTQVVKHPGEISMVGHRVVHGGPNYRQSGRVTPEMVAAIGHYTIFAPEHNPANLEGIHISEALLPGATQVAVFDTAFHRHLPPAAAIYPGPYEWYEQGILRYGFHGINHQYCTQRASELLHREQKALRLITCHLGNGCSLAAVNGGQSVDTTMGFTPMEGLMMGTRSGSVDPGIMLYLLEHTDKTPKQLDETLNKRSGLRGILGASGDMRSVLQARATGNPRATLAFDMFVHRLRACIGSMLTALGGLDALVFSGGIGEHAPEVRTAACEALGFLDLAVDEQKNAQATGDQDIASTTAKVRVLVIAAQEDWMIARECWRVAAERQH
jgi:acetate kinase